MPVKKHAMKITTKQRAARKRNIEIARRAKKGGGKQRGATGKLQTVGGVPIKKKTKAGAAASRKRAAALVAKRQSLGLTRRAPSRKKEWSRKTKFLESILLGG
jgi:hypothetical protein